MGNMLRKKLVDSYSASDEHPERITLAWVPELTMLPHAIVYILVYRERIIIVLGTVHPGIGHIQVHAIITRFRNSHSVIFEGLNVKLHSQFYSC
jgi:hypothetical protein